MSKKDRSGWFWMGVGLLAGAGIAAGSAYAWKKTSERFKPQTSGSLSLTALSAKVEVLRDRWGVAHIYAQNEADLFCAQGYVQAQDRLWQMELNRRAVLGRLAGLFGERALDVDLMTHRSGLAEAAARDLEALDPASASLIDSYCAGVNAFIEQKRLPVEFTLLRYEPSAWTPLDVVGVGKLMAWSLSGNYQTELIRARLLNRLGSELASKLEPIFPQGQPIISPPGARYEGVAEAVLDAYHRHSFLPFIEQGGGSNNWTVSGCLTDTGSAMLANDPHLALQMPNIWYEAHLNCPEMDVIGASLPGTPCIVLGHNRHIAWGVTSAMVDVQDLFIERFHKENPRLYLRDGQWVEAETRTIEIEVKGRPNYIEEIPVTVHGPVIANLPGTEGYRLSMQWVGHQPANTLKCILAINKASNWEEFRRSLPDWQLPALNFVYADTNGNIGYQLVGHTPIRRTGGGTLPLAGWDSSNDWQGFIPFEEMPSSFNPEQGFIVTANNRVVGEDYPYHLSSDFATGYRAERITELLRGCEKVTIEDCVRIQNDCFTIPGKRFATLLVNRMQGRTLTPLARKALQELERWDGVAAVDSCGETIYQTTFHKLMVELFRAPLGEDLRSFLGGGEAGSMSLLNSFAGRSLPLVLDQLEHDDPFLLNLSNPARDSWNDLLEHCLLSAVADLSARFGSEPKKWRWGRLHTASFEHPLGAVRGLRLLFNRGPIPFPGDGETPVQAAFLPMPSAKNGFEARGWLPSYRQIIDLGDFDRSLMILAGGQSGSPFSPHYDDFIQPWSKGKLHPMLFTRSKIEETLEATLELLPTQQLLGEDSEA